MTFKANLTSLEESLKKQLKLIEDQIENEVNIRLANRIILSDKNPLLKAFEDFAYNMSNTDLKFVNFKRNSEFINEENNNWIHSETKGVFSRLFDTELSDNTSLALANSVFFEAFWKNAFTQKYTIREEFFGDTLTEVETMKMWRKIRYVLSPQLNASVIELPFRYESDISLIIVSLI